MFYLPSAVFYSCWSLGFCLGQVSQPGWISQSQYPLCLRTIHSHHLDGDIVSYGMSRSVRQGWTTITMCDCVFQFVFGNRQQNIIILALKGSTPSFELSVKVNRAQYILAAWRVSPTRLTGKAWGFKRRARIVPKLGSCFELQRHSCKHNPVFWICAFATLDLYTAEWSVGNTPMTGTV